MPRVYIGEEEFAPTGGNAAQSFKCDTIPDYDANSTQDDAINMNVLRHYNEGERNTLAAAVTAGNQATTNLTNAQTGYTNRLTTQETKSSNRVLRKVVKIKDMTDVVDGAGYADAIEDLGVLDGVTIRIGVYHTGGKAVVFLEFVGYKISAQGHLVSFGDYIQLGSGYANIERTMGTPWGGQSENECLSMDANVALSGEDEDDYEGRCVIGVVKDDFKGHKTCSFLDVVDYSYKSTSKVWTIDTMTPRYNESDPTEAVGRDNTSDHGFLLVTVRTKEV